MDAVASLRTDNASRYFAMLCMHFARRLDVTICDQTVRVVFPFGQCALSADPHCLHLIATAHTKGDLGQVEEVIANHLERYAFRENPELVWKPAPDAPATGADRA